jgi:hypothetical protein
MTQRARRAVPASRPDRAARSALPDSLAVADGLSLQESIDRLCDRILDRDWGTAQSMVHTYLKKLERVTAGSRDYAHGSLMIEDDCVCVS